MTKTQEILHTNDGEPGCPTRDRTSFPAAMASGRSRDEARVGHPGTDDAAGSGPRSLLADAAEPKGRRSLFRR